MVICAGPATPLSCCDLVFGECNKELSSGAGSGLVVGEGTEGEGEGRSLARLPCTLLQALLGNVYVWCWHGGAVCVRPSAMYSCVCMWAEAHWALGRPHQPETAHLQASLWCPGPPGGAHLPTS